MKNLLKIKLMAVLFALVLFSMSCSSDDHGGGSGATAGEGTITAKINGQNFESTPMATFATETTQGGLSFLNIEGSSLNQNALFFQIFGYEGPGTYKLVENDDQPVVAAGYLEVEIDLNNPTDVDEKHWDTAAANDTHAEVHITEVTDTHVIGTFNFKGYNEEDQSYVEVTNGAFNVAWMTF